VANGLAALAQRAAPSDWVLVHDAARPCLSGADLGRLLEHASEGEVGALLALPLADTLKRAAVGPTGTHVAETLPREGLWLAQTPQMFRLAALAAALEQAISQRRMPTDEAQAMDWQGARARLVATCDGNFKVTNAADLALAEALLAARSS
jgi:2-C-methyl-D-erythritol 4-phosphate cytidylyltransferase